MAVGILTDQKVWLEGLDLTGRLNAVALEYGVETDDDTAFGDDTRSSIGGLKTVAAQHEGFFDAQPYDERLFDQFALADVPMSIAAASAEGSLAYFFKAQTGLYTPRGRVGELFRFSVAAHARGGPLVRGTLMHDAQRTATGNGTARQLGVVSASQSLYAALHVVAVAGTLPTLDVTIESDDAEGFPSATPQITFAEASAVGAEYATPIAGVITDDWWRVAWTLGGTSPDFTFAVVVGIQ